MARKNHSMDTDDVGIALIIRTRAAVRQLCHTGYLSCLFALTLVLFGCADPGPTETESGCNCTANEVCFGGQCLPRCTQDSCPSGQECRRGVCLSQQSCRTDDDCIDFEAGTQGRCIEGGCYSLECDTGDSRPCETACGRGTEVCRDSVWRGCDAPPPRNEVCGDGVDNNCNGSTDEGCGGCSDGDERACTTECGEGTERCVAGAWRGCSAERPLAFEICGDNVDNDCNGNIDDGCDNCTNDEVRDCQTECGTGSETCVDNSFTGCNAEIPSEEVCDGQDNDCDGQTDEEITRDCSNICGRGTEVCESGQWAACTARIDCACSQGENDEQICGVCGVHTRTCGDTGWSPYSQCEEGGNCVPGEIDERRCGNCGTDRRLCTSECNWGEWQGCRAEGECAPGTSDEEPCGECGGVRRRTCNNTCEWDGDNECMVPESAECAPGAEETRTLDRCGQEMRLCENSCAWGAWQVVTPSGVCEPGAQDGRPCGPCDAEVRTCQNDCRWGEFGACQGGGLCDPGQNEEESCGDCGTRSRVCNGECIWNDFSACRSEGECPPGASEERECGTSNVGECTLGSQFRTCSNSCGWSGYSQCRGNIEPRFDSCGNGLDEDCDGADARNPDQYETNDDCFSAHFLGTDPDTEIQATIDTADDNDDYFYFTAVDGFNFGLPEYIEISLTGVPDDADYDLFLYRGLEDCVADDPLGSSTAGIGANESISWGERFNTDDDGDYYVRVQRFVGNACFEAYSLSVDGLN